MRLRGLFIGLLFGFSALSASAQIRFDGNFWRSLDSAEATYFLIGYLRGADMMAYQAPAYICLSQNLSDGATRSCYEKGHEAMSIKYRKLVAGRAYSQFVYGLHLFFSDHRNRSICINSAVSYVTRDINGLNSQYAEKWLTELRELPTTGSCDF